MTSTVNKKLFWITFGVIVTAWLCWTLLFYNNPVLSPVLWDIHFIYTGTLIAYGIIKYFVPDAWVDLFKIFIRTMFRVWLIIFITLVLNRSMERVGLILSVTFIFGYFEGLVDIDRWLLNNETKVLPASLKISGNKNNHMAATLFLMSLVHILGATLVWIFYLIKQY